MNYIERHRMVDTLEKMCVNQQSLRFQIISSVAADSRTLYSSASEEQ